jgi:hypothetical protein
VRISPNRERSPRLVTALDGEHPKSSLRADASGTRRAIAARFGQRELASNGSLREVFVVDVNIVSFWFLQKVSKQRRVYISTSARGAVLRRGI